MLVIIAHHYVTATNIQEYFDFNNPNIQQYYLSVFGMWGKTAINSFVLISGYFLCNGSLTWMRWLKLFAEIFFYHYIIQLFFIIKGVTPLSFSTLWPDVVQYVRYINGSFTSSFLVFYAFIPILNKTIKALNKQEHLAVCLGLLFIFTIADTFFHAKVFNEPFWYMSLFFIASYIRLYPSKYFDSIRLTSLMFFASVIMAVLSVVLLTYLKMGGARYVLVVNSDKILAFLVGLYAFLMFKNFPNYHNKVINFLAEGTFAVYLIHTAGANMLKWLWGDIFHVDEMFSAPIEKLVLHSVVTVITIFLTCSILDYFRRRFIEKPFFSYLSTIDKPKCIEKFMS